MSNTLLSAKTLALLRKYDTPTVCNVIELFDIRPCNSGYMDKRIRSCFPSLPPMVGYASTATFKSSSRADGDAYSSLEQQVEAFSQQPSPPIIVFEDLDQPSAGATFGEIMCTTYKSFGAEGLVTSGTGRDLDQVQALDFPVFMNGSVCSHGYCQIPSIQVPVTVGGIVINPGDLLHGDRNGVTTIPHSVASDVPGACAAFMRAEAVVLEYLEQSDVTPDGLSRATAECHRMIDVLREQVTRNE